ncbi:MAG: winged helix-turn-helix domain-containing protein [Caulobacterales bacterium]|uniref:winged helix-turn-helix domain-containing protein n=1 Tax=Glycocaulis sp. TaxID=1969725 RepID=UPI003FA14399
MADFNSSDLDDVIHGRMRLGLMAYLASVEAASFGELKDRTGATDGNLSTHLRKLEDAGYVSISKRFVDRKPRTDASLTDAGRAAWIRYLDDLKKLVGE